MSLTPYYSDGRATIYHGDVLDVLVDLYAGPGGWSEGARLIGLSDIGIELDPSACATRSAAGHRTIRADVTTWPLGHLHDVDGLIASPPCQAFSAAGKGDGRDLLGALCLDVDRHAWDAGPSYPPGVRHVIEVGRWATTLRPRWIAAEQVPPVLPLWEAYARVLARLGYSTWAGVLNAADYGVPQTRRRAILLASLDRVVAPPAPTHAQGGAATLFGTLAPWVSMADALGWGLPAEPSPVVMTARNRQTGHDALNGSSWRRDWFARQQAAGNWVIDRRTRSKAAGGTMAPTVPVPADRPAPTLTVKGASGQWVWKRPATTVAGDPHLSGPGRNDPDVPGSQYGENSVRLTIAEALTLQSFPSGYPVQGTKTKCFEQVGNAVPPLLAAHILAAVTGRALPQEPVVDPRGGGGMRA